MVSDLFSAPVLISGGLQSGRSSRLCSHVSLCMRRGISNGFVLSPFGDKYEGLLPDSVQIVGPSVCRDYGVFSVVSSLMESFGSDIVVGIDDAEQLPDVRSFWTGLLSMCSAMRSSLALVVPDMRSGSTSAWQSGRLLSDRSSMPLRGFPVSMLDVAGGREIALGSGVMA